MPTKHPVTPDNRYFVVRGRLWRMAIPCSTRTKKPSSFVVSCEHAAPSVMRRSLQIATPKSRCITRSMTSSALRERGEVWWNDGAPDLNRHMVKNTREALRR